MSDVGSGQWGESGEFSKTAHNTHDDGSDSTVTLRNHQLKAVANWAFDPEATYDQRPSRSSTAYRLSRTQKQSRPNRSSQRNHLFRSSALIAAIHLQMTCPPRLHSGEPHSPGYDVD